jgi:trk system potassium uptake protein TrkA
LEKQKTMSKKFCIIGLGYFGKNLALDLSAAGAEVLAIDNHQEIIDEIGDRVTHAVCMDSTDKKTLVSMGLKSMDAVVVAIGEGFESSVMTTALLQEIGVKKIYARVISAVQERLLGLMNIHDLLVPEADAAAQLAERLLIPGVLASFGISKEYGIFEIETPARFVDKKITETRLREEYNLNLVTIIRDKKRPNLMSRIAHKDDNSLGVPSPDTIIQQGDVLVLFGREIEIKKILED